MCGIVGYIGQKSAENVLISGLRRLEYRGYDSAGICLSDGDFEIYKSKGKIADLEKVLKVSTKNVGIGHTRWATHGEPSDKNAHPHLSCDGKIALVHNGIIENYETLRQILLEKGHKFASETDTEVLVHLIEDFYHGNLVDAVRRALQKVVGTYGICVLATDEPEKIVVAKKGSPLVIGIGEKEFIIASDTSAILNYTKKVIYLDDDEIATVTKEGVDITGLDSGKHTVKAISEIEWDLAQIEKVGFEHFMLKEIFEQPQAVKKALSGRINGDKVNLGGLNLKMSDLQKIDRVTIVGCGTSWHAGMVAKYAIESLARIPVDLEYASEFRYKKPILDDRSLVIVISQSGETADTLAGLSEAKNKGAKTLGIINVVGSTIARTVDGGIYTHAGPEIGVASTKAYTTQVAVLILFAVYLANSRDLSAIESKSILQKLEQIPEQIESILDQASSIKDVAYRYAGYSHALYLGRDINLPTALEGALKLKEISYIHAEAYPTAEMKHGAIALIDKTCPSVILALKDALYEKSINTLKEIKARNGRVLCIGTEGDTELASICDDVVYIPNTISILTPLLAIVPLQLIAYYIAAKKGCEIDQPRNLAKSVTVE